MSEMFKEGSKTSLGTLRTHSGTLAFTDGIHAPTLKGFQGAPVLTVDVVREDVDIPVFGIIAEGKRYILISIDEAKSVPARTDNADIDVSDIIEVPSEHEPGTDADADDKNE